MHPGTRRVTNCRVGVTILELIIVLTIVSALLALLFPAVQHAREAARRAAFKNNVRQLTIAMEQFIQVYKRVPERTPNTIRDGQLS